MIRLRTPTPDGGAALSSVVTADDGARIALLHEPGLVRIDVQVVGDTLRTRVRDLHGGGITYADEGTVVPRIDQGLEPARGPGRPVQLKLAFTVHADSEVEVRAVLAAERFAHDGRAELSGQARLRPLVSAPAPSSPRHGRRAR